MPRKSGVDFDVICIGAGPTSLFAALELTKLCSDLKIGIFETGRPLDQRTKDNLVSGVGGAGAFSDGKLTLPNPKYPKSLEIGGQLASIMGNDDFLNLAGYVSDIYTKFGGRLEIYEKNEEKIRELVERASIIDLKIIPTRVRHFGSDLSPKIIENIIRELQERRGVAIYPESPVRSVRKRGGKFLVRVGGANAGLFKSRYLIAAPGRVGAGWLASQNSHLGFEVQPRQSGVDIGIRVEVPKSHLAPITDYLYDPKMEFYPEPFKDRVRSFCVCPFGEVLVEHYQGLLTTVNGHSLFKNPLSENTNFALLVTNKFTEPFKEPIEYARSISENANRLAGAGKVLVQRLGDLRNGKRSKTEKMGEWLFQPTLKEAVPGDITFAIPYRQLTGILKMLEVIDALAPGVNGQNTLLYAAEVKFYSSRIKTTSELEAEENFFVGGDGAGVTRGLVQSSASGVLIARAIAKKLKTKNERRQR